MSTSQPAPGVILNLPTAPTPPPRSAFGWPPGSIRALLTLLIVGLFCAHILILPLDAERLFPDGNEKAAKVDGKGEVLRDPANSIAVPGYLIYLLFLVIGHYFATRGHARRSYVGPHPLYLPRGSVRFLVLVSLVGSISYAAWTHNMQLKQVFDASLEAMKRTPELPLVLLSGFFLGVFFNVVLFRRHPPGWWQDIEAWLALLAVFGICVAGLIHLVINRSLDSPMDLKGYEGFLTAMIAFYFGDR